MWYYESETGQRGPADDAEVRRLIAGGQIRPTTRIWRDGQREWLPAAQTDLAGAFPLQGTVQAYVPNQAAGVPAVYAGAALPALQPQFAPAFGQTGVFFAGFWIRVAAILMDGLFIYLGILVLTVPFLISVGVAGLNADNPALSGGFAVVLIAFIYLGPLAYYIGFNMSRMQATPGKRIVGIYIVRESGKKIGFWFAIGRQLAFILSAIPLYIGFMMAGWTSQNRALHDMVCSTRVVYGRPPR